MTIEKSQEELWIPDNPDGSGWASVDWTSVARGRKYFYRHAVREQALMKGALGLGETATVSPIGFPAT